ncbi:MAG TPA: hypothetical protein EYP43_01915, partial [Thermoplasmata archaeon]|nr:hypothetical protein [Thermoplasmata archaeon]
MRFGDLVSSTVALYVKGITKSPLFTVGTITIITLFLATHAARLDDHISSDFEIYLPKGAEESRIIKKIAEHWATNVEIIFIETDNAYYPDINKDNITDKKILDEISYIEGDENWGGLNPYRDDRGKKDDIAYSISISILIKEINSSGPRIANALEGEMAIELADILGAE